MHRAALAGYYQSPGSDVSWQPGSVAGTVAAAAAAGTCHRRRHQLLHFLLGVGPTWLQWGMRAAVDVVDVVVEAAVVAPQRRPVDSSSSSSRRAGVAVAGTQLATWQLSRHEQLHVLCCLLAPQVRTPSHLYCIHCVCTCHGTWPVSCVCCQGRTQDSQQSYY